MKNNFLFLTFLGCLFLSVTATDVSAQTKWDSYAPNAFYAQFVDEVGAYISGMQMSTSSVGLYKKITDDSPIYYEGYIGEASYEDMNGSSTSFNAQTSIDFEYGKINKNFVIQMDTVEKGGVIYARFPLTKTKGLKEKWIHMRDLDGYTEFGEKTGMTNVFSAALFNKDELYGQILEKVVGLAKKYNYFIALDFDPEDGYVVPNATRYNFTINPSSVRAYHTELSSKLTGEERNKTLFAFDGFEDKLSSKDFVNEFANYAYISIWIDNTTQRPVRFLEVSTLPPLYKKGPYTVVTNDVTWSNINKSVVITAPESSITIDDAAKLFKIKLDGKNAPVLNEIAELIKDAKKAKKAEKADYFYIIAKKYEDIDMLSEAADYYKKSAALYTKNTAPYYEALAEAEWALQNPKKVIEYFEKARTADSNDDLTNYYYGYFLMGISPVSAKYQDLNKALEINKLLVKNKVDDANLLILYTNYTLLGMTKEAEALKDKFDNFESPETYITLARAYHRMGDHTNKEKYLKLAKNAGYIQSSADVTFLKLKF